VSPAGRSGIYLALQATGPVTDLPRLAARAEQLGFARLLVADHPGSRPDPFVTLASVASATSTLELGTYVVNAGIRDPWQVAVAATTLDQLSGGRFALGLGAGHTPAEWTLAGRAQASPGARVDRLHEFVEVTGRLLAGEPVTFYGEHFRYDGAQMISPRPLSPIPIIIGGNGRRVLQLAGRVADIVSMTGFGRTLADGHDHAVRWSTDQIAERVGVITAGAQKRDKPPQLEVLIQHLELTQNRTASAQRLLNTGIEGLDLPTALHTPFLLFGTPSQIVSQMRHWHQRFGVTGYVVRPDALPAAAQVIQAL
jgi:probable F420-dependent oxidoreductase